MGTRIFISHSRKDEHVAKALVDAIETGIAIPSEEIRCTSVAGYDLAPGDDAPEVLRRNLRECSIVLEQLHQVVLAIVDVHPVLAHGNCSFSRKFRRLVAPKARAPYRPQTDLSSTGKRS